MCPSRARKPPDANVYLVIFITNFDRPAVVTNSDELVKNI